MSPDRYFVLLAAAFGLVGVPLVVSSAVLLVDVGLSRSRRLVLAGMVGAPVQNGGGRATGPRSDVVRAGRAPVTRRAGGSRRPAARRGPS